MAIRDVVTAGFGSWEIDVRFIPTRGFGDFNPAPSGGHGVPILVGPPYLGTETHPYNKAPRLTDFTEEERVMLLALGVATELARRQEVEGSPVTPYNQSRLSLARALLKASDWLYKRQGIKAVGVIDRYQTALNALAARSASADDLRGGIVALLALYALYAYEEGFSTSGANVDDMTPADSAAVAAWVASQSAYADGLAEAMAQNVRLQAAPISETVTEAVKADSASAVTTRIGQWKETLNTLKAEGRFAGYKQGGNDIMVTFHLGPTREHCRAENGMQGCEDLDHQRHPFSWFVERGYLPRQPANPNITCHGFYCLCYLTDDVGNVIY